MEDLCETPKRECSSFKRSSNRSLVHLPPAPAKDEESTPAPRGSGRSQRRSSGRRSDRGSSFEKSSNRILLHLPPATKPASSVLFGPSELGNDHLFSEMPPSSWFSTPSVKPQSHPTRKMINPNKLPCSMKHLPEQILSSNLCKGRSHWAVTQSTACHASPRRCTTPRGRASSRR